MPLRKALPSIWGFVGAKWKGRAEFLHLRFLWIRGSLAGTRVYKQTALVKTVRIFQTKHPWSMVNWQLNPELSNTSECEPMRCQDRRGKPNSCVLELLFNLPTIWDKCNIFETLLGKANERGWTDTWKCWKCLAVARWLLLPASDANVSDTCWVYFYKHKKFAPCLTLLSIFECTVSKMLLRIQIYKNTENIQTALDLLLRLLVVRGVKTKIYITLWL